MLRTDCANFEYDHDMGKSIPCCKITITKTACNCDTGTHYIYDCDGCDKYKQKIDEEILASVLREQNIMGVMQREFLKFIEKGEQK